MFVASAAEGWPVKYVTNNKFYNDFRSVDVSFVFRFGASPSGSPVVENMKSNMFYKLFVDTTGAYFGGSLGHAVAVPGAHFALRNNTNTCKFYQCFWSIFYDLLVVIFGASRSKLFLHRRMRNTMTKPYWNQHKYDKHGFRTSLKFRVVNIFEPLRLSPDNKIERRK